MTIQDPSLERTFKGHKGYVTSLSFSPNMKHLASSAGDNEVLIWNFKPQLRAFRFVGHTVRNKHFFLIFLHLSHLLFIYLLLI